MGTAITSKASINLLRGWPSTTLLPATQLASAAQIALSDPTISTPGLLYGPDEGYGPLRSALSTWTSSLYSVPDDPSRICVTGGASQNLACALQVFTDPFVTQAIWMAAPCYFLACRIFEDAGFAGRLRAVREDDQGLDVESLEREIERLTSNNNTKPAYTLHPQTLKASRPWSKFYEHIIYVVPTFSNPSGKTMSLARRKQLIHLARKHNALIITDDVYDMLQWPTDSSSASPPNTPLRALLPRLTDIDRELESLPSDPKQFGHTMSNQSFSKILGPGVRTGWTDSSTALSYALSQCGSSRSGGCASQTMATIITQLIVRGQIEKHIKAMLIPTLQRRWNLMIEAIDKDLGPLGVRTSRKSMGGENVFGGYFIWIQLPKGIKAAAVATRARETEELIVAPGELFEVYGDEKSVSLENCLRLCFSWVDECDLVEGIHRLRNVIKDIAESEHDERANVQKCIEPREGDLFNYR
ncbi:MAG: hypothetical protein M1818_001125 [Claussenomyces sp. TS43310]|nr:MAG: hypothetical protein M1818_001125 [Claussenomyces sp. TS43310]